MWNRDKTPHEYFDGLILPILSGYSGEDLVVLSRFLFVAFSKTAEKYYKSLGLTDRESSRLLSNEHHNLRTMVARHKKTEPTEEESIAEETFTMDEENGGYTTEPEPTDDQFLNDATIDMNLLIDQIEKRE